MTERRVEELLGGLPEESPPPEVVLAAVRGFRYRAIATVAVLVTLIVVGGLLAGRFLAEPPSAAEQVAGADRVVLAAAGGRGGARVMVWEVAWRGRRGWLHTQGWKQPGAADFTYQVTGLSLDGRPLPVEPVEDGGCCAGPDTTGADDWFAFDATTLDRAARAGGRPVFLQVQIELGGQRLTVPATTPVPDEKRD
jgi:hypothetical protein